jgi:NADH dehydrogenase
MILVVGATGHLGSMITRMLLDQGQEVRILVRPHTDYQALVQAGAQPVTGDLKERTSLDPACDGVNSVITTANSASRGGVDNPQTVDLEGNRNLIEAANGAGVQHFIFTSAIGADPDSPIPFIQAKGKSEHYLRASGMPYTIFQPTPFMDIWIPMVIGTPLQHGQPVTLVGEGHRKHAFIAVRDVAAFTVAAIGHAAALNQSIMLGGPEAVSWWDIISIIERVVSRSIPVQTVAIGEPVPGFPDQITGLMTSLEMYDSIINMRETAATFGVTQTTIEAFVQQTFAGMSAKAAS